MGLGIVKTSWTTVILPPYSSSIILGYLIYRKTFTHSYNVQNAVQEIVDLEPLILLDLFAPAIRILSRTLFIRPLERLGQEFGQEFKKNLKAYRSIMKFLFHVENHAKILVHSKV